MNGVDVRGSCPRRAVIDCARHPPRSPAREHECGLPQRCLQIERFERRDRVARDHDGVPARRRARRCVTAPRCSRRCRRSPACRRPRAAAGGRAGWHRTRRSGPCEGPYRRGRCGPSGLRDGGESEKHHQRSVELDELVVAQASEAVAQAGSGHGGELVDHEAAGLIEPVVGRGVDRDPDQGRIDGWVVNGQTVTDAVASKRSSWTIRTGRGLPV